MRKSVTVMFGVEEREVYSWKKDELVGEREEQRNGVNRRRKKRQ